MKIINKREITFSDLKEGDCFEMEDSVDRKIKLFLKIQSKTTDSNSVRLTDFHLYITSDWDMVVPIKATLTVE